MQGFCIFQIFFAMSVALAPGHITGKYYTASYCFILALIVWTGHCNILLIFVIHFSLLALRRFFNKCVLKRPLNMNKTMPSVIWNCNMKTGFDKSIWILKWSYVGCRGFSCTQLQYIAFSTWFQATLMWHVNRACFIVNQKSKITKSQLLARS